MKQPFPRLTSERSRYRELVFFWHLCCLPQFLAQEVFLTTEAVQSDGLRLPQFGDITPQRHFPLSD